MAQGGDFATGALTGAVSAGSSLLMDGSGLIGTSGDGDPGFTAVRVAVAAVAGGTTSVLSGGKFANGAITGAFAQMYNGEGVARAFTRTVAPRMAATAGLAATLAAIDGPLPIGDLVGGGLLIYDAITTVIGTVVNASVPDLPEQLTGENPRPTRGRTNTDLPGERFPGTVTDLTGGNLLPDSEYPGHLVAPNGVRIRLTADGPRIDIPAQGPRPHETVHFPAGTRWPW